MKKSPFLRIEFTVVLLVISIIGLLDITQKLTVDISLAVSLLIILGFVSSFVLPNLILTWLAIFGSFVAGFIMIFGVVYLPVSERLILILTFPFYCWMGTVIKYSVGIRGSALSNRNNIITYTQHVNSITKLKNSNNASRYYKKYLEFIEKSKGDSIGIDATCIQWAHSEQLRQVNTSEYRRVLRVIADKLKEFRLPDESLYYLEGGTFLIFSPRQSVGLRRELQVTTEQILQKIKFNNQNTLHDLQFKYSNVSVNSSNLTNFDTFEELEKKLRRKLETDIIVEYQ
jgi:GGDEF domain-containing protein